MYKHNIERLISKWMPLFVLGLSLFSCNAQLPLNFQIIETNTNESAPIVYDIYQKKSECINSGESLSQEVSFYDGAKGALDKVKLDFEGVDPELSRTFSVDSFWAYTEIGVSFPYIVDKGTKFSLCLSEGNYPEESIEYVALSLLYQLDRSKDFVHKSLNKGISNVSLLVHPYFRDFISSEKTQSGEEIFFRYLTDNASFYQLENDYFQESMILMPPQSLEVVDGANSLGREVLYKGIPLWSFPFVSAHEYGHHVFQEFIGAKLPHELTSLMKKAKSNHIHHFENTSISTSGAASSLELTQKEKVRRMVLFVEESFADLFAYYSVENKYRTFKDVNCFENLREIDKDYFKIRYTREDKKLDSKLLQSYSEDNEIIPREICEANSTNPYRLSSVASFIIHKFSSRLLDSDEKEFRFVYKFYSSFLENKKNLKLVETGDVKSFVVSFYMNFFHQIKKMEPRKDNLQSLCEMAKKYVPALRENQISMCRI